MLQDMIFRHMITVFMIVVFTIVLWNRKTFKDAETKYFWVTVISCAILVFEDVLESMAAMDPSLKMLRIFVSVIGYTFRSVAAVGLWLVVTPKKKRSPWMWAPCFVTMFVSCTAFFSDIAFGYDENYHFYRNPLGLVVFAVPLFYMFAIIISTNKYIIERKGIAKYNVPVCVIMCFMAAMSDAAVGGIRVNEAMMFSCVTFYIFLYAHDNRRDTLTGLLNRQAFYDDCIEFADTIGGVVSLDMNGLKMINDRYGHEAGDKALITVGKCINDTIKFDSQAYRVGGDEFIILVFHRNEDMIVSTNMNIKKNIEKKGYHISLGHALVMEEDSLEEAIRVSDKLMYEDKARFYQTGGRDRRRR